MTKPSATVITSNTSNSRALQSAPTGRLIKSSGKAIIPQAAIANADTALDAGTPVGSIIGLHTIALMGLACGVALSLLGPLTHGHQNGDLSKAILASLKGNLSQADSSSSTIGSIAAPNLSPRQKQASHAAATIADDKELERDPLLSSLPLAQPPEQLRLASFSLPTRSKLESLEVAASPSSFPKSVALHPSSHVIPHGSRAIVGRVHSIIKKYSPKHKSPGVLAHTIVQESAKQGVDPLFVAAVIKAESTFNNTARSNKGAQGLMQIMPATGAWLRQKHDLPSGKLSDPGHNLKVGITYLKELVGTYKGDRMFALVAYNWGPGHVDSATGGKRRIPKECMTYALKILGDYKRWRSGVI
jgi:soluble lytic murein transglycosylase